MIKIKNKSKDPRKFRDSKLGKDIIVAPGEEVETNSSLSPSDIWEIVIDKPKTSASSRSSKKKQTGSISYTFKED